MGGTGTGGASQRSSRPAGRTGSTWPSRRRRFVLCLLPPSRLRGPRRPRQRPQPKKIREKSAEGCPAAAHPTAAPATPTTPEKVASRRPGRASRSAGRPSSHRPKTTCSSTLLWVRSTPTSVGSCGLSQSAKKEKNIVCENCEKFLNPNAGLVEVSGRPFASYVALCPDCRWTLWPVRAAWQTKLLENEIIKDNINSNNSNSRRKFRSYTSDNMDSWKAEVRRVRREKIRRKKM